MFGTRSCTNLCCCMSGPFWRQSGCVNCHIRRKTGKLMVGGGGDVALPHHCCLLFLTYSKRNQSKCHPPGENSCRESDSQITLSVRNSWKLTQRSRFPGNTYSARQSHLSCPNPSTLQTLMSMTHNDGNADRWNKYTQIASRALRQALNESDRVAAEKRAQIGV